jgi:hypothetical protein
MQAQDNPSSGRWKLNLAKSKYNPGPPPRSETRTYEPSGEGLKASVQEISANGDRIAFEFVASYDGKDYPYIRQGPNGADTVAIHRIDANSIEFTAKKAGKVATTGSLVVSKDGNALTITSRGTTASGQITNNVQIFDKE